MRLAADGPLYELVISDGADVEVERFDEISALLDREREIGETWRTQGWNQAERRRLRGVPNRRSLDS
jgi:hypothetical protein